MDENELKNTFAGLPDETLLKYYYLEKESFTESASVSLEQEIKNRHIEEKTIIDYLMKNVPIRPAQHFICSECGNIGTILRDMITCRSCGRTVNFSGESGDGKEEIPPAESAEDYFYMGNNFSEKGNAEQAIEAYEKAIKLDPFLHDPYFNLALIYIDKGYYDLAWQCAHALKKLQDPDVDDLIAELEQLTAGENVEFEEAAAETESDETERTAILIQRCPHCREFYSIPDTMPEVIIQCPHCFGRIEMGNNERTE